MNTTIPNLKKAAAELVAAKPFPSPEIEEWRHTRFAPVTQVSWTPSGKSAPSPAVAQLAKKYSFNDQAQCELVFVNGYFAPELSTLKILPKGLEIQFLSQPNPIADEFLGKLAKADANPFVAWNTAQFADGAAILIARGAAIDKPIHLLFIAAPSALPTVNHPRTLVVAKPGSASAVVETYVSLDGQTLTNAVTEIIVEEDAVVDHCKLQQESQTAYHFATQESRLAKNSQFISHAATIGAKISRNDVRCALTAPKGYATMNGLVLIGEKQFADNHTYLEHASEDCMSHELYKHVLDGESNAVFKGKILVRPGAQKTDSKQTSKTLLLTDNATVNSQPALEIYADDVKCTHGCATGPVDDDMVFYLQSRGISKTASRQLLTYAFAADVTRRIKIEPVRDRLESIMAAQHDLPLDIRIADLGAHDVEAL